MSARVSSRERHDQWTLQAVLASPAWRSAGDCSVPLDLQDPSQSASHLSLPVLRRIFIAAELSQCTSFERFHQVCSGAARSR